MICLNNFAGIGYTSWKHSRYEQRWINFICRIPSVRRTAVHTRRLIQNGISIVRHKWQWNRQLRRILSSYQKNWFASENSVSIGRFVRPKILWKGMYPLSVIWRFRHHFLIFYHYRFGQSKNRVINYAEFTQLIHDFHEEHAMEAFKSKDPKGTGYISPLDFQDIMVSVKKHLLTHDVKDNLVAVS